MSNLELRQIFDNYLSFEKELIKIFDLSFSSLFPQLLTITKLRLGIDLCIIINENDYFSSLNIERTKDILDTYKKNDFSIEEIVEENNIKYFILKLYNSDIYLFFCFDSIDIIYKSIFENIRDFVDEITNKEKEKKKLKELQSIYKEVVNSSRDPIFICDMQANILLVSPVCKDVYGYTVDEFLSDPSLTNNMLHDDYNEKFHNFINNFMNGELPKELTEWAWIRKDGEIVYTENTFSMIKGENNEYIGFQVIARNITERKLREKIILEKNRISTFILSNIPAFVWSINKEGVFLQSFGSGLKTLEFNENQLAGLSIYDVYPEHADDVMKSFEIGENRFLSRGETNGEEWCFDNFIFREKDILLCFSLDITKNIQTENLLKNSLNEKETLIKEIHHRVKNNMQVISSLLNLQASQIKDKSIKQLFNQSQNRIKSMALAHETLYQSETLSNIDLNRYVNDLIHLLSGSFGNNFIKFIIECENIVLDLITVIPTGLIINELVSNSLKYAFPEKKDNCIIQVSIREIDNKKEIIIQDNGIGFPTKIDFKDTESLGLQLVNSLINQINGDIKLISVDEGTKFVISF
jgi:PAS domain S-box-containing protein